MASRLSEGFRERTKGFAALVIRLYVSIPKNREEVRVCGKQLLRSGTSVAAHVREASRARSDQEFIAKIGIALQEVDESCLWLELLHEECGLPGETIAPLKSEANELLAILSSMISRTTQRL
jgi:four helix bundle protein